MMLNVADVHAGYGNVVVLRGLNLEIQEGEIVCLLGANGAGKSTTLRVVSGLIRPLRGNVLFQKQDITRSSPNEIVGLGLSHVPEGRQIFATLTVRQNLLLGGYAHRQKKERSVGLFDFVFNLFPILRERVSQKGGTLSGGEQQMLAISRSLMSQPKLLLLDEPSLGLAPLVVIEILRVIQDLRAKGISMLLVEQNATAALHVSNRAYVMENGKITGHGKAKEMLADDEVRRRYLGR